MAETQSDKVKDVAVREDPNAPSAEVSAKRQSLSDVFTIVSGPSQAHATTH